MDIKSKIYRYKLPLVRSLKLKGNVVDVREGLILAYLENDKIIALGDIAPLPGFSRETITQAEEQLVRSVKNMPLDQAVPGLLNAPVIETMLEHAVDAKLYPSVEIGICTALLNLISKIKGIPVRKIISPNALERIKVNALLSGSEEEITEKVFDLKDKGFSTFKLKVGRQSLDDDIALVKKVCGLLGEKAKLHLDANRAWDVADALTFGKSVKGLRIEYIEEPVKDYLGILQLCNGGKFNLPIALDESLVAISPKAMEHIPGVMTLVLKPTILGFVKTIEFNKMAKSLGMKTVISSSFESSVGLFALAEFAAGFGATAGLDTIECLTEDILESSFDIKAGHVDLSELSDQKLKFESSYIEEISLE
jgi:o-succinylbenzoate synthase